VKDPALLRKLGLTLVDARLYQEALAAFERLILVNQDSTSAWYFGGRVWRGILNDLLGHREVALESYGQALAVPGHPRLQHTQFDLVLDRAWVEERLKTPFVWP
jgi:tetratricopeptide (TPR) repeat protein